ncbi:asparaginase [Acetobacter orleanensis]|uniref:Asparaginase n=1 Tax=Acetobacter orleanensis TaxID=104099 RepID=A0A4Y3TNY9_9PROT|nr:asparaginase [Acetobacter orleanensis]KXV65403.1 asparaginase [Acetobacter orleanensis]PCD80121.1 asparaginase [Acetobacter orleanensis]GAN68465.1 L-asparaginase II [Acetobacter orleanensis JCM 7639]GBR22837.1 L-asparaginase II [Acetobacter orleanensis NRIC 0473]GEB82690.1 asparaginase [Acetobacter orleanensis]
MTENTHSDTLLAEVTRGGRVESRHYGAAVVVDASGKTVFSTGDITTPLYPRSTVKALLALPLLTEGAADKYALPPEALALACASHQGEPDHVAVAADMLARTGWDYGVLECGAHWPLDARATRALAATGEQASALHNCCSGKHAGFICLACGTGQDPANYSQPDHPLMQTMARTLAEVTGAPHSDANRGIDGCAIPTWAIPLTALALGYARFATGTGLSAERALAAQRLRAAMTSAPFMIAGTDQFDTLVMHDLAPRVLTKMGAEGVMIAALPEKGLGIAIKCRDGGIRAAETAAAALIARFGDEEAPVLNHFMRRPLKNWNGAQVGELRAAAALAGDRLPDTAS